VTLESANHIATIRTILSKLELTAGAAYDEQEFTALKRILDQRILDLENGAPVTPLAHPVKFAGSK
jgi:hypothetical protein